MIIAKENQIDCIVLHDVQTGTVIYRKTGDKIEVLPEYEDIKVELQILSNEIGDDESCTLIEKIKTIKENLISYPNE